MQSFIGLGCYIESPHRVIFIIYLRIYVVKTDILLQDVYVSGAIVTRDLRFRFLAFEDSVDKTSPTSSFVPSIFLLSHACRIDGLPDKEYPYPVTRWGKDGTQSVPRRLQGFCFCDNPNLSASAPTQCAFIYKRLSRPYHMTSRFVPTFYFLKLPSLPFLDPNTASPIITTPINSSLL